MSPKRQQEYLEEHGDLASTADEVNGLQKRWDNTSVFDVDPDPFKQKQKELLDQTRHELRKMKEQHGIKHLTNDEIVKIYNDNSFRRIIVFRGE